MIAPMAGAASPGRRPGSRIAGVRRGWAAAVVASVALIASGWTALPAAPAAGHVARHVVAGAAYAPIWSWPVVAPHPITRAFVAPASRYAAGHRGIDVRAPVGSPVTAPDDGEVVFAGRLGDRGVLAIQHAGGVRSSFEPVVAQVHAGQTVRRGQPVAVVATGGLRAPGTLFIGARIRGAPVSPLLLLGGLQRAVLLPMDR